jgi:hypothetical protein
MIDFNRTAADATPTVQNSAIRTKTSDVGFTIRPIRIIARGTLAMAR